MARHMGSPTGLNMTVGVVNMQASFVTNGTSQPVGNISLSTLSLAAGNVWRGEGIATISRTAVGTFLVTMDPDWMFRYHICKFVDMEDIAVSDGSYCTVGAVTGEAAVAAYPQVGITFYIYTHAAAGALTDFGPGGTGIGRRVSRPIT